MNGNGLRPDAGEIHLYYADLRYYRCKKPEILLSPDEAARADRYRFEADTLRYVRARCLLREVLSVYQNCTPEEVIFEYSKRGKPFLKGEPSRGVQFNLSHSGDMAALAVSCGRSVGIDIEKVRNDRGESDSPLRFFSEAESAAIRNSRGRAKAELFFRIWTRKEALLKATGEGIGGLPGSPDILKKDEFSLNGTVWHVYDLNISPGYRAALATEGSGSMVRIERFLLDRSGTAFPPDRERMR